MENRHLGAAVILAAGMGKRMNSAYPKAGCKVLGKPMIQWVTESCLNSGINEICVVVSQIDALPLGKTIHQVVQQERLGTGHSVMMAIPFLEGLDCEDVVVLYGDAPFVDSNTLQQAFTHHRQTNSQLTVITAELDDPARYGRIIRNENKVQGIIEYADATTEQRAIGEINSGIYLFNRRMLLNLLPQIRPKNAQGEYYLTDTVALALENGYSVEAYLSEDDMVVQGANNRLDLAKLNQLARDRIIQHHYQQGVDIPFPETIMISPDTKIGRDTMVLPSVTILGKTIIGEGVTIQSGAVLEHCIIEDGVTIGSGVTVKNSRIGKGTTLTSASSVVNSQLGTDCQIQTSVITDSTVGNSVRLGPYAQLRPNSVIANGVKIGNFVEIKNSTVGERTSVAHLTYIGDSDVGERCNFGCGVVTVNYDGARKYRTKVGNDVFIGCNANLIPPVSLGDGSYVAAATTVTEDLPAGAFAIGRSRQTTKENYTKMPNRKDKP